MPNVTHSAMTRAAARRILLASRFIRTQTYLMCICGLDDDTHWFVDSVNAPDLWQIGSTPEQAEHNLKSWAGRTLKIGHDTHIDMRAVAARVLAVRVIFMHKLCESKFDVHPGVFE